MTKDIDKNKTTTKRYEDHRMKRINIFENLSK